MSPDLVKGGPVAAVVSAWPAKGHGAAVKDLSDYGGNFANAVILLVVADVKDFVVHCLTRRLQGEDDRLADVLDVDQRPPRRAVARHPDLSRGPGKAGKIVEDNVEAHARAGAECSRVAQEHR